MEEKQNQSQQDKNGTPKKPFFDKQTKKRLFVVGFGIVLFVTLSNIGSIADGASFLVSVIMPFVLGAVFAFFLNPLVRLFENRVMRRLKHKRGLSILATYVVALAAIIILLIFIIPQLVNSIVMLYDSVPGYLASLDEFANMLVRDFGVAQSTIDTVYTTVSDFLSASGAWVQEQLPTVLMNTASSIASGFMNGFIGLVASIYMLANKEKLRNQVRRVLYAFAPRKVADKVTRVAGLSNDVFSGFLTGRLLESLVMGIVCFIFMSVVNLLHNLTGIGWLQMPYALLISTLIGITNIIPYFGPFLGTIPALIILLMVSPLSALLFLAFIIVLQQLDNYLLAPKLIGLTTGLPTLWVFVGTILGGQMAGITGMLLGVPVTAVLYVLGSELIEKRLKKRGLDTKFARTSTMKVQKAELTAQTEDADKKAS